jgi:RNA polymerase sigma factor (sigma-70 family)
MINTTNEDELVADYMPLVERLARRRFARVYGNVCYDEWLSDALLGLVNAIRKFDPEKNTSFKTYATVRINGAMLDGERNRDHLPRLERQRAKRGEIEPPPPPTSIDSEGVPESFCRDEDASEIFTGLSRCLGDRSALMFTWYYRDGITMKEIGKLLELSESRVSQLMASCRKRLKEFGRDTVCEMIN